MSHYYEDHPFEFEDFLTLSAHLDIDVHFLKMQKYFDNWIAALDKAGRISITKGCYNTYTYSFK